MKQKDMNSFKNIPNGDVNTILYLPKMTTDYNIWKNQHRGDTSLRDLLLGEKVKIP